MDIASNISLTEQLGMHPALFALLIIWTLVWKGLSLWRASGLRQKKWFIALLVINTLGILDIFYLFYITRNDRVEVIEN